MPPRPDSRPSATTPPSSTSASGTSLLRAALVLLEAFIGACGRAPAAAPAPAQAAAPARARDASLSALGRSVFFDPSLSGSGRMACATCHDPRHAYGPPNALPVQLGGAHLDRQGMRAVPSLRYVLNRTPAWFKEYVYNPAERAREGNEPPSGGFGWDGRFNTL